MGTPSSLGEIREAQRADGPAGTANPANHVIQAEYPDYYFRITNSEHMIDLKEKFKRMSNRRQIGDKETAHAPDGRVSEG
ncbi:hypothetical protein YC2023_112855 [Brassica napus]